MAKKVAEQLVEMLEEAGVKRIYAGAGYKLMVGGRTKEIMETISSNFKHMKEVL